MKSIIFDVDGTIWDSVEAVAVAWTNSCKKAGYDYDFITPERLRGEFGKLMEEIGRSLFTDLPEDEAIALLRKCCQEENEYLVEHGPDAYPEIPDLFQEMKKRGYPVVIVSNCQAGYIEALLARTGLYPYVMGHLCPGDTGLAKAENIKLAVEKYHLEDPAYLGDTMGDYTATKKAGLPFLFASYGFGDVPNPDGVVSHPLEVLRFLN
ncbi:MAG: HAD family hydrolase [Lachnospiraceae bacterium]|nr:HAD family hydrolase [Lachnospiraceae bacterium]